MSFTRLANALAAAEEAGDYDDVVSAADRILRKSPHDADALRVKVVALIKQAAYADALSVVEHAVQTVKPSPPDVSFEKAYCLYRLNRLDECLAALEDAGRADDPAIVHLRAQALHRLRRYDEAGKLYRKHFEEEDDPEMKTNILASVVASGDLQAAHDILEHKVAQQSYEAVYNYACGLIDEGRFEDAEKELERAEKLCRETLTEDDYSEDEIRDELSVIHVQQGYLAQREGKIEEARKIYLSVLAQKPSDASVVATAANNVISLRRGDENLFDSLKKSERALRVPQHKLSATQKEAILFNRCLLFIHAGKIDKCKEVLEQLRARGDTHAEEYALLVDVALFLRDSKINKAITLLERKGTSVEHQLTLVQALLSIGKTEEATDKLRSMEGIQHKPGVVATLVHMLESQGNVEGADALLEAAVAANPALEVDRAQFQLRHGRAKEAVAAFDALLQKTPSDAEARPRYLGALVVACAQAGDKETSQKYEKEFPALDASGVDMDALEKRPPVQQRKKQKRQEKKEKQNEVDDGAESKGDDAEATELEQAQKLKKKKRKKRYPKNFDPANPGPGPDPERWLPKYERTAYKKKRGKKGRRGGDSDMRGAQGATPAQLAAMEQRDREREEKDQRKAKEEDEKKKQQEKQKQQQKKKKKKKNRR